jgi:hypothetical protein
VESQLSPIEAASMSTHTSTSYLVRRVAARAAVGVWRHRGGLLLAALVSVALVGYVLLTGPGGAPTAQAQAAPIGATSDCADAAMAAIASTSPAAVQQAYQCLSPAFQQQLTEPAFSQQMQALRVPNVTKVDRLSTYMTPTGGTLVYYAVVAGSRSVGYVVSLGPDGKVLQIK